MTERNADVRSAGPPADLVTHKAARECPMIEPHPRAICGIVRAREANQQRADEERRGQGDQPGG